MMSQATMGRPMYDNERDIDNNTLDEMVDQNPYSPLDDNRRNFMRLSTFFGTASILGGVIESSKSEAHNITNKPNVRKIALEEHFNSPSCAEYLKSVDDLFDQEILANISDLLVAVSYTHLTLPTKRIV